MFNKNIRYGGQAKHQDVLLGMHFVDGSMDETARKVKMEGGDPTAAAIAGFLDYIQYIPEDLEVISYADFWRWWYTLERYKGDELGLAELDNQVNLCLQRGIKVKIDLAYCTWYTVDKNWEEDANLVMGPVDMDDWIHLCDLLGRHYHGRIVQWMLQGESNDLKNYWKDAPITHVQDVFMTGYRAFKHVDPGVNISISGASPSVSVQMMDEWYHSNLTACKGFFDATPMNYFADILGADPYQGLSNYYQSIKNFLDEIGETDAEIDSGESSIQWAGDSYDLTVPPPLSMEGFDSAQSPLSELKQSWRMNESCGTFYQAGGNKFVWWGSEFAPATGWSWRWGFRKYEDLWGIWQETDKIPGTRIVYRYDGNAKDPRPVNYLPAWVRPEHPYHPVWYIFKFWAQATPPAAEAIRIPADIQSSGPRILSMATYLQAKDQCVLLLQADEEAAPTIKLDLSSTTWRDGLRLNVSILQEKIDYATGCHLSPLKKEFPCGVQESSLQFYILPFQGFTTIRIEPGEPEYDSEYIQQVLPEQVQVGRAATGKIIVQNSGTADWAMGKVRIGLYINSTHLSSPDNTWILEADTKPGEVGVFSIRFPACDLPGYATRYYRLCDPREQWFGPLMPVSTWALDILAPRKLLVFRELGHIRLKWFAPSNAHDIQCYEIQRAIGFEESFETLQTVSPDVTEWVDIPPQLDKAYYYQIVAIHCNGQKSQPSNQDNARALSNPRIWDAEIISHTIPTVASVGTLNRSIVTLKNTGIKTWNLSQHRFFLNSTQLWDERCQDKLPQVSLGSSEMIEPGQMMKVEIPIVAPRPGIFENHWILCVDISGKERVYLGTPLLVETLVKNQ